MTFNTLKSGGQQYNFVNPPPDSLICLICTFVAKDALQMNCCGKVYCTLCLTENMKYSNKCPNCRQEGMSFKDTRSKLDTTHLTNCYYLYEPMINS